MKKIIFLIFLLLFSFNSNSEENLINSLKEGGKLIFIGNGASASLSSHAATDFTKQANIPSIAFNDHNLITALSNDYGYENWVSKALEYYASKDDRIIFISVSGESKNLINGLEYAKNNNLKISSMTGSNSENTIKKNSEVFNIKLWNANIIDSEIISVFAGSKLNRDLLNELKKQIKNKKIILWTNFNHINDFSKKELEKIIWIRRELEIKENRPIYSDLPELYEKMEKISLNYNFFILYDNSININFRLISPESSIKILSENFGNVIWPSINSNKIIFNLDKGGKPYSTQKFGESDFTKENQIEVLRGNGTILSRSALINPQLMFKDPKFEFIDSLCKKN